MSNWSTLVRQASVLFLLLAVALAVVMLTVAHQVQGLEDEVGALRREFAREQQKIHVLEAEFSTVAEPERLRRLSGNYLELRPIEPQQLAALTELDQALLRSRESHGSKPLRGKAPVQVAVASPTSSKSRNR